MRPQRSYVCGVQDRPCIVCAAAIESGGLADAIVGVGKAAAAMHTTRLLLARRPAWLLVIGVCGAYAGSGLEVGALCVVGEDCLADEVEITSDHVFPRSWYPDTTPANLEKWQMPSCRQCNADFGRMEEDLLLVLALCADPNADGVGAD